MAQGSYKLKPINDNETFEAFKRIQDEAFGVSFLSATRRTKSLAITFNERVIGTIALWHSEKNGTMELSDMAIEKQSQRQGHGRAAIELAKTHAKNEGYKQLGLFVLAFPRENNPSKFYEKCGFHRERWNKQTPLGAIQMICDL